MLGTHLITGFSFNVLHIFYDVKTSSKMFYSVQIFFSFPIFEEYLYNLWNRRYPIYDNVLLMFCTCFMMLYQVRKCSIMSDKCSANLGA